MNSQENNQQQTKPKEVISLIQEFLKDPQTALKERDQAIIEYLSNDKKILSLIDTLNVQPKKKSTGNFLKDMVNYLEPLLIWFKLKKKKITQDDTDKLKNFIEKMISKEYTTNPDILNNALDNYPDQNLINILKTKALAELSTEYMRKHDFKNDTHAVTFTPQATSIVERGKYANAAIIQKFEKKKCTHAWARCAQGLPVDKKYTPEQMEAALKDAVLYQIALGIVAFKKVDGNENQMPNVITLGNFMTSENISIIGRTLGDIDGVLDSNTIALRKKIVRELQETGLSDEDKSFVIAKIKEIDPKIQAPENLPNIGNNRDPNIFTRFLRYIGLKKSRAAETAGIPLVFVQQGVNAERLIGHHSSSMESLDAARYILSSTSGKMPAKQNLAQDLINSLQFSWQKRILRRILVVPLILDVMHLMQLKVAINGFKSSGYNRVNDGLDVAAKELVLARALGGVSVSGCKSAKDRQFIIEITAESYEDFYQNNGKLSPAFGSIGYYLLPTKQRKELDDLFAAKWCEGYGQFVAYANAQGAAGIKNCYEIMTNAQQKAIARYIKNATEEQKNTFNLLSIKNSLKLSKLNKIKSPKKTLFQNIMKLINKIKERFTGKPKSNYVRVPSGETVITQENTNTAAHHQTPATKGLSSAVYHTMDENNKEHPHNHSQNSKPGVSEQVK